MLGRHCRRFSAAVNPFPFPQNPKPTPHQIFHLPPNAAPDAVKDRYYELVRIYHPDRRNPSTPAEIAHSQFQSISAAYNLLRGSLSAAPESPVAGSGYDSSKLSGADWRAMHIRRRRKLYEGGDDRWRDWIIFAGAFATIAAAFAQITSLRRQAMSEMIEKRTEAVKERQGHQKNDSRLALLPKQQ
ncbi:hypothetical protein C8J56DRAFT_927683 [Mycena floridula]|nr:hypothetical protein C8J56DRAFT_927683 [Mycena floridula]